MIISRRKLLGNTAKIAGIAPLMSLPIPASGEAPRLRINVSVLDEKKKVRLKKTVDAVQEIVGNECHYLPPGPVTWDSTSVSFWPRYVRYRANDLLPMDVEVTIDSPFCDAGNSLTLEWPGSMLELSS